MHAISPFDNSLLIGTMTDVYGAAEYLKILGINVPHVRGSGIKGKNSYPRYHYTEIQRFRGRASEISIATYIKDYDRHPPSPLVVVISVQAVFGILLMRGWSRECSKATSSFNHQVDRCLYLRLRKKHCCPRRRAGNNLPFPLFVSPPRTSRERRLTFDTSCEMFIQSAVTVDRKIIELCTTFSVLVGSCSRPDTGR